MKLERIQKVQLSFLFVVAFVAFDAYAVLFLSLCRSGAGHQRRSRIQTLELSIVPSSMG
jgi:hypothetical protein